MTRRTVDAFRRTRRSYWSVTCRLCGEEFLAISHFHLAFRHGWRGAHPIRRYLERFAEPTFQSGITLSRKRRVAIARAEMEGRHWSRQRIIDEIQRRRARGLSLAAGRLRGKSGTMYAMALKRFGSWPTALRAAGIDPAKVRLVRPPRTREEVIAELRQAHREGAYGPGTGYKDANHGVIVAARRHFGSWHAALKAAGVPALRRPMRWWTRDEIREWIRARAARGESLRSVDVYRLDQTVLHAARKLFRKTWRELVVSMGFPWTGKRRWNRATIIREIRRLAREGVPLGGGEMQKRREPVYDSARHHYSGGWKAAVRAAGLAIRAE